GSLSDLLDKKITMEEMKKHVLTTLEEISDSVIRPDFSDHELTLFGRRYEQMIKRNEKIAALQKNKSASARSATYELRPCNTGGSMLSRKATVLIEHPSFHEIKETCPFIGVCRCWSQRP